jgi:hypothetical protein
MSAVKHAFQKVGQGIEHVADSAGKDLKGLGKVVDGVLTANPSEIKNGFSDVGKGLKEGVSGLGEIAGGAAGAVVSATPLGAAVNALTHNKLEKLVEGVGDSCAGVINNGIDGVGQLAKGIAKGDLKEALKGALNVGSVAMLAIPGAGEAEAAADVAMAAGRGLLKQGVENKVFGG